MPLSPSPKKHTAPRSGFEGIERVFRQSRPKNRPAPLYQIVLFVVVPSLLIWTVILLVASGDLRLALLIGCVGLAAGILGWFLRLNQR